MYALRGDGKRVPESYRQEIFNGLYIGETAGIGGLRFYIMGRIAESCGAHIEFGDSKLGGTCFDMYFKPASSGSIPL